MASGDQYRIRAKECTGAAEQAADPERRLSLLELAGRWMRLAEQADEIMNHSGNRGDALLRDPPTQQQAQQEPQPQARDDEPT
jgi:hypothetical protein